MATVLVWLHLEVPGRSGRFPRVEGEEAQGEYDKLRRRVLWSLPYGLYLVGSRAGSKRNMMTLNWADLQPFVDETG